MNKINKDLVGVVILLVIPILFFANLFWPEQKLIDTPDFGRSDAFHMSISTKYFLWQKLQHNELPVWSSQIDTGFPVLAEGQIGTFFLPNLVLYKVFDFVNAYNMTLVLAVITFTLGVYVWLRVAQFDPVSALFGASSLGFSGIIFTHLTHITLLQSLSLTPWVLAFTLLLIHRKSRLVAAVLSLLWSQQLCAGFVQASFITAIFATAYFLWMLRSTHAKRWTVFLFVCSAVLAIGMSAAQILPSQEFLKQTTSPQGFSLTTATQFSYPFKHLVTFLSPYLLGDPRLGTYPSFTKFDGSIFWENTAYIGIVPLFFVIIGLSIARTQIKRTNGFFLIALLLAFLLMLGKHSPAYFVYSFWPFTLFRVPSRFIWVFAIALMYLSTLGFSKVWKMTGYKKIKGNILVVLMCINVTYLLYTWSLYNSISSATRWLSTPEIIRNHELPTRVVTIGAESVHNATFLTQGWTDIKPFMFLKNTLFPNSNLLWNVGHVDSSVGRELKRNSFIDGLLTQELGITEISASSSAAAENILDMLAVDTLVTPLAFSAPEGYTKRNSLTSGNVEIAYYKRPNAAQRAYLATQAIMVTTLGDVRENLTSDSFLPGQHVLLEDTVSIAPSATGSASIVQATDNSVIVEVKAAAENAVLVIADTFYPGWKATVDGVATTIYPANLRQKAIVLPGGDHLVELQFFSEPVFRGLFVSIVVLLVTIGFGFVPPRLVGFSKEHKRR